MRLAISSPEKPACSRFRTSVMVGSCSRNSIVVLLMFLSHLLQAGYLSRIYPSSNLRNSLVSHLRCVMAVCIGPMLTDRFASREPEQDARHLLVGQSPHHVQVS